MRVAMDSLFTLLSWQRLAIAGVLYVASVVIYRLFFHPLAQFPGSKLAAATLLYEGYYDLIQGGQYTFKIAELHKEYGPIIRISPNELHVIDPSFYKTLYRQDGRWNKDPFAQDANPPRGSAITTVDHYLHKARRQPMNAFFSKAKVVARQEMIRRHLTQLCNRIARFSETKETFDLGISASAFTRDIADEYILGQTFHNLDAPDFNSKMTNMIQDVGYMWFANKFIPFPFIRVSDLAHLLPRPVFMRLADEGTRSFMGYLDTTKECSRRLIKEWTEDISDGTDRTKAMANGAESSDATKTRTVVHEILDSNLPPSEKTLDRIWNEITTVTGAGFETTASALRLIYFHIWTNPTTILQRVREELAAHDIPHEISDLDIKTLEQLPYLTAIITEGLRLSPAIATRMGRIAPDRDLVYADSGIYDGGHKGKEWVIPAGSTVGMTTVLMHMDEKLYPNPREFNPERWMDPDAKKMAERNGNFAPFSRGTRVCLGMYLAWAEMYMILTALIQRFDFAFEGVTAADFECTSDQFIIGTTGKGVIKATATKVRRG